MATRLEILQGQLINTYLAASNLPAFKGQTYFVDGEMQPNFESLWDNPNKLSNGEKQVFLVAKEIWSWLPEVLIFNLGNSLSTDLLSLTFSLYQAWFWGETEIRKWIIQHQPKPANLN